MLMTSREAAGLLEVEGSLDSHWFLRLGHHPATAASPILWPSVGKSHLGCRRLWDLFPPKGVISHSMLKKQLSL